MRIILTALYLNATLILHLADVALRPLKAGSKKSVCKWGNGNPNSAITRKDFAPILSQVINDTVKPEVLKMDLEPVVYIYGIRTKLILINVWVSYKIFILKILNLKLIFQIVLH